eukprot:TRINITY_DN13722_c0_g1_i1.p1 TRINITY_DN13722_c0_g1~~TRINITY_DN13722_c0_g1_i1.p1  ORF type:complete len:1467 (-),score=200.84 TRINITY_DN13722_c0_g1_i1:78-4355(-)
MPALLSSKLVEWQAPIEGGLPWEAPWDVQLESPRRERVLAVRDTSFVNDPASDLGGEASETTAAPTETGAPFDEASETTAAPTDTGDPGDEASGTTAAPTSAGDSGDKDEPSGWGTGKGSVRPVRGLWVLGGVSEDCQSACNRGNLACTVETQKYMQRATLQVFDLRKALVRRFRAWCPKGVEKAEAPSKALPWTNGESCFVANMAPVEGALLPKPFPGSSAAFLELAASKDRGPFWWNTMDAAALGSQAQAATTLGKLRRRWHGTPKNKAGKVAPNGFEYIGMGSCRRGYYTGWRKKDAASAEQCAEICASEKKCRFFSFLAGKTCSRYDDTAQGCLAREINLGKFDTYAKTTTVQQAKSVLSKSHAEFKAFGLRGYRYVGEGYCQKGYFSGWKIEEASSLEKCASICTTELQCQFFSFMGGKTCSRYDKTAGSCKSRITARGKYVTYEKDLAPMAKASNTSSPTAGPAANYHQASETSKPTTGAHASDHQASETSKPTTGAHASDHQASETSKPTTGAQASDHQNASPPGFPYIGKGRCRNGYYTGWKREEASSLAKCANICKSEAQCLFFSFLKGKTCSRYGKTYGWDDCKARLGTKGISGLYKKAAIPTPTAGAAAHYKEALDIPTPLTGASAHHKEALDIPTPLTGASAHHNEAQKPTVPGFTYVGQGRCKKGYYIGWKMKEASSVSKCAKICDAEDKCKFFSFLKGKSCSRYGESDEWDDCKLRVMTKKKYELYKKGALDIPTPAAGASAHHKEALDMPTPPAGASVHDKEAVDKRVAHDNKVARETEAVDKRKANDNMALANPTPATGASARDNEAARDNEGAHDNEADRDNEEERTFSTTKEERTFSTTKEERTFSTTKAVRTTEEPERESEEQEAVSTTEEPQRESEEQEAVSTTEEPQRESEEQEAVSTTEEPQRESEEPEAAQSRCVRRNRKSYQPHGFGPLRWLMTWPGMSARSLTTQEVAEYNEAVGDACVKTSREDGCNPDADGCERTADATSRCLVQPVANVVKSRGVTIVTFSTTSAAGGSQSCRKGSGCMAAKFESNCVFLKVCGGITFKWKAIGGIDWYQFAVMLVRQDTGKAKRIVLVRGSAASRYVQSKVLVTQEMGEGEYSLVFYAGSYKYHASKATGARIFVKDIGYQNFIPEGPGCTPTPEPQLKPICKAKPPGKQNRICNCMPRVPVYRQNQCVHIISINEPTLSFGRSKEGWLILTKGKQLFRFWDNVAQSGTILIEACSWRNHHGYHWLFGGYTQPVGGSRDRLTMFLCAGSNNHLFWAKGTREHFEYNAACYWQPIHGLAKSDTISFLKSGLRSHVIRHHHDIVSLDQVSVEKPLTEDASFQLVPPDAVRCSVERRFFDRDRNKIVCNGTDGTGHWRPYAVVKSRNDDCPGGKYVWDYNEVKFKCKVQAADIPQTHKV